MASDVLDRTQANGPAEDTTEGASEAQQKRERAGTDPELLAIGRMQRHLDEIDGLKARGRVLAYLVARNLPTEGLIVLGQ